MTLQHFARETQTSQQQKTAWDFWVVLFDVRYWISMSVIMAIFADCTAWEVNEFQGLGTPHLWICNIKNKQKTHTFGQIIATSHDLTPKKPRLVKYYNLARYMISKPPSSKESTVCFPQLFLSRNGFDFDAFVCDNCSLGLSWVTRQCRYVWNNEYILDLPPTPLTVEREGLVLDPLQNM